MTAPANSEEAIETNVVGPKQVTVGGQTVVQHSLQEQIAADRYLASKSAATNTPTGFGLRFQKIIPPGAG